MLSYLGLWVCVQWVAARNNSSCFLNKVNGCNLSELLLHSYSLALKFHRMIQLISYENHVLAARTKAVFPADFMISALVSMTAIIVIIIYKVFQFLEFLWYVDQRFLVLGLAVDENTKDSVGSDNYSGGSGNLNEDSNMSFPGTQDENSNDADMKLGKSVQVQSCYGQGKKSGK